MDMARPRLPLIYVVAFLGFWGLTCSATTYVVGDNSGWDISTDLDTWTLAKKFVVGDILLFQYSSSNSVNEVTKQSFDGCNTTNVIKTYSNGNSTVTLSRAGGWYFISGNKLYCLGGMKLEVNVQGNQTISPVAGPQAQPGTTLPQQPSSKNNNPVPTSHGFTFNNPNQFLVNVFFAYAAVILCLVG
ncbi:mavicyanin [Euphorbia lathyris]|uniref:mavicyanin n=1 Tax=Euphorbia lathyris TaxID=212925 RepID=UPI0033135C3B